MAGGGFVHAQRTTPQGHCILKDALGPESSEDWFPWVKSADARAQGTLAGNAEDWRQGPSSPTPRASGPPQPHSLKSSDPPERTGTGVLKCEGSLGSSGAWGKLRPRVEERLGPVTKPIGGKARASGDSDSGLSLGLSHAYVKGPSPGSQLQDWA